MSPDGIGQVLIYPYYTAQSAGVRPYNTYVSIVNHDGRGKALRVRFREGRNGREVLSFNLFLQGGDSWAGAIVPTAGGAQIRTVDQSCTSPGFPVDFAPGSVPARDFSDEAYKSNDDGYGVDLERIREGYAEVFEMAIFGDITPDPATHCDDFRAERVLGGFDRPVGGLSGTLTLINVADGMDFTVNATALSDVASRKYYRGPADPYPDFDAAEINKVSAFVQNGKLYRTVWPTGLEAVDAALMRSSVTNEVVLDSPTQSATDWILTMPTRRFHVGTPPDGPFKNAFIEGQDIPMEMRFFPRDGYGHKYGEGACDLPLCPGQSHVELRARWSTTVLAFRAGGDFQPTTSDALGSRNAWGIGLASEVQNGSAFLTFGAFVSPDRWYDPKVEFGAETTRIDNNAKGYEAFIVRGMPVVGFMVRTFRNGTLTCDDGACQGNYGGSFPHRLERTLER